MNLSELKQWLIAEQEKWALLVAAIGLARLEQPGVNGDWSMRDIIAHLTGWHRYFVAKLEAAAAGRAKPAPPWPAELTSEVAINAWIHESNRTHTVAQVLADADETHEQVLKIIQGLPDNSQVETVQGKFHVVWVNGERFAVGEFFHHFYDDHAADVLTWLKRGA